MKSSQENINRELEIIKNSLEQFKEGASLDDLKKATGLVIEPRTLQRRLDKLQKLGVVTAYGKTRATLYYLAQAQAEQKEETVKEQDEDLIPLSNEGKEIRKLVMQPVARRRPVGYNIDFLTSYRPNVDSYLTLDDKRKLTKLGDTARLDQPAGTYAREILQRP